MEATRIADAILKNYDVCEIGRSTFFIKMNRWFDASEEISESLFLTMLSEVIPKRRLMFAKYSLPEILEKLWNAETK